MINRYNGNKKTIFITVRGYESYNNIAHVIEKGTYFLLRCKDISSNCIIAGSKDKLPATDLFDCHLSLILTRKWTNEIFELPWLKRLLECREIVVEIIANEILVYENHKLKIRYNFVNELEHLFSRECCENIEQGVD